jgi:hypothetical protein
LPGYVTCDQASCDGRFHDPHHAWRPHPRNLDRWQRLIQDGDLTSLRHVMTGLDLDLVEMREVSPMGGLLSQEEHSEVLMGMAG